MVSQRLLIRLLPVEVLVAMALALVWAVSRVPGGLELPAERPVLAAAATAAAPVISPVFTPEVQSWAGKIKEWADAYGLDPNLVATVMQVESCGLASAVSGSGAQGLFQVMPFHFSPGEVMQDPDTNARRGLTYLALGLTRAGGDVGLALAGYNGGHSQIGKAPALWSAQTQRYWYWGTGIYADAVSGQSGSPRLQAWLQAGGASLCARAAAALAAAPSSR